MSADRELFRLKDGRVIIDEDFSEKLYAIKKIKPEERDDSSSGFEWSEIGMANLFGKLYRQEAAYCPEYKSWFVFDGTAWARDEGGVLISEKIKDFVRLMILYCGEIGDDDVRKSYAQFVNKMGDRRLRDRIQKDAMGECRIGAEQFDRDPYLINCQNGTYDLKTYCFREHRWSDYITMTTRFRYSVRRDLRCERWEKFIAEVTQGDEDKALFLQKALGYSLLGKSNEECMFILYGKTTRNGKSTLLNTLEYMLGDYAKVAHVGLICQGDRKRDVEGASPMLAGLKGKRFVTMAESNAYGRLDEEQIKQLTGGEEITARALYSSPITYRPQFTIWLSCNDLPSVSDKSLFASERLKVIEFGRHFSQEEQDKTLKDVFSDQDAMSGIFAWLVRGYKAYTKTGLVMSDALKSVVREYEKENDVVLQYLEEKTERCEGSKLKAKDLYNRFKMWAKSVGVHALSSKKFNSEMLRLSEYYDSKTIQAGYAYYTGIAYKQDM